MNVSPSPRLISLDAFRGITIAGMILVNNPGSWKAIYGPLRHAEWDGWTPTDLVFPFFLFIVGVAMTFAFQRRLGMPGGRGLLAAQVVRRSGLIFVLGLILAGFPDWRLIGPYVLATIGLAVLPSGHGGRTGRGPRVAWLGAILLGSAVAYFVLDFAYFQASELRVPGVLQRIAVCYLAASLIVMAAGTPGAAVGAVVCTVGYALLVTYGHAPADYAADVKAPEGLLHDWVDVSVFGNHLYRERPEPEGVLSTIPAIATTLLGFLAGRWLTSPREERDKTIGMFAAANVLLVAGLWLGAAIPINKKIWSSSYVLLTAGLGLHFLAMCYYLIDVRGWRRWSWPFVVFGTNAIVVYVASSLGAKVLGRVQIAAAGGETVSAKGWLFEQVFAPWAGPSSASLLYALAYVTFWLIVLIPLYRRKIFVRV